MFESQPISGRPIWLGFHAVRGDVDTGGHRYGSCVFGAVRFRGIYESGMGPYLLRVRRKCPPLMNLYPPRTALWSSNLSAISQRDWGFLTVRGGFDPRKLSFLPPVGRSLRDIVRPLDRGWDSIFPRWSWLNIRTQPIRSAGGVGISTPCREVSTPG